MNVAPSYLVKALACQYFLLQEEHPCKLTVCMEAYLLTCVRGELCTAYKGPNFFNGE